MPRLSCGVDFGTTNSTVGLCEPGGDPFLIPVDGPEVTIPSALFFSLEDGSVHFGRSAVHEYMEGAEGRFMRALKSILGTSLMKETTQVGRDRMTFERLIGRFLRHLRSRLETQNGGVPEQVVLGRPVFFVDHDPEADRTAQDQLASAARSEGFSHVEFQFEPVAAALHFERSLNCEVLALVVDIGGGTSDFSVLRLSPARSRSFDRSGDILSTSGVHVGGADFDRQLSIAQVMPFMGLGSSTKDGKRRLPVWYFNDMATWHKINQLYTARTLRDMQSLLREAAEPEKLERYMHLLKHRSGHRLAAQVEKAKAMLDVARQLGGEDGNIVLVTVIEDVPGYIAAELPTGLLENAAEEARGQLRTLARNAGLELAVEVRKGSPATAILDVANERKADVIVIASHRPGLQDYFLGSTAARVVRHAKCSVHVIR